MPRKLLIPLPLAAAAAALMVAGAASASTPTSVQMPSDSSVTFTGADSPCDFDITFTGAGTVNVTTYYDNAGNPIRESAHGSLTHTVSSAWHTLSSEGPAPVQIDLTHGLTTDAGEEFAFHPGHERALRSARALTPEKVSGTCRCLTQLVTPLSFRH